MDILSILLFVLGVAVGAFVVAVWLGAQSDRRVAEAEARVTRDLEQARRDAVDADLAHHETKQRLIALQLEHERVKATAVAPPQATGNRAAPDDLKRIKGIGPSLERKLHELGITRLEQIARLSAVEVERIDAQLDFPGRIRRERWVEQARALLRP